jgi:glycosyltransferase involved in cell wall biosynthesis
LRAAGLEPAVIVVDDGSGDDTAARVRGVIDGGSLRLELLTHEHNRGYGAAQKTGLARSLAAGHAQHVILHADGQYAPEELPEVLSPLAAGEADVVIGSKFAAGHVLRQGMPLARWAGMRLADALENRVAGLRGLEFHSGYMAYTTAALADAPWSRLTDGFHIDGELVRWTARRGLRVVKVPIATTYGGDTSSLAAAPYLVEVAASLLRHVRGGP